MSNDLALQKKEHFTKQAKTVLKRTTQDIIDLSQICHEYHEEFGDSEYRKWWCEDLGMSRTRAFQMLNVQKQFGASTLNVLSDKVQPVVLHLISAPSTPEPARKEIIEKAEQGETITHKQAKEIIAAKKKIKDLEDEITDLESCLPTESVLDQIANLEQQLKAAKKNPVPDPQMKADLAQAQERARDLEQSLLEEKNKPPEVVEVIPASHEKLKKDNQYFEKQVESQGVKINTLSTKLQRFADKQKEIDSISLISDAHKALTKAMVLLDGIVIVNRDIINSSLSSLTSTIETFNNNSTILEANFNEVKRIN
jgi:hypothetical protein